MKNTLLAICFIFANYSFSQIFMCKDGKTKFTSEAPLELIKAESVKTVGAIDCGNKNVAFSVNVDSFNGFNSGLQKEHFRENYLETMKYPNATFKGKIIEDIDFKKNGTYTVRAKGKFNIHGTEKEKIVKAKIVVTDTEIIIDANFEVPLEDHNISVPKVVNQKIASVIMVSVAATLKKKS
ncbi:MAG: YceI family protein [Bacteroidota bacterium]|nr:YceI family protein [Bacteroidota bacterium]MDP3145084.1 YceI family protein [Bacteroidota bacterium]MDP3556123.1 YceI family protein [Bacteroidota bacterium]